MSPLESGFAPTGVDWTAIGLSLRLATVSTALLLITGLPLAWLIAHTPRPWRIPLQVLVSMPLVLPPTVLGFYLLLVFSPAGALGKFVSETLGLSLAFSFTGLVLASWVFSLPFMVNPLIAGFDALPKSWLEAARVLGKSRLSVLRRVQIPNLKPALFTGVALSFAHTMGEFGVVLMIGGKIPGVTRVASVALFDEVETLNFANAHVLALILFALSFILLAALFALNRKGPRAWG